MNKHVLIEDNMYFISFIWKCVDAIRSGWVGLMEVRWAKSFEVEEKYFELRKQVKVDEKFKFSYLEKFSHLKNLDVMENLEKLKLNPLSSQKTQVNSHS